MSLYTHIFHSIEVEVLLSEKNTLAYLLQVEAVLAEAQAKNGIIPVECAEIIARCCNVEALNIEQLKLAIPLGGNAAIPLVKQLTLLVKQHDETAAKYVHLGATSQDIVDTATVLQIKTYREWLLTQLRLLEQALIQLTLEHSNTLMMGRTLLQQAKPITFGLKTAGWLASITRSKERVEGTKNTILKAQLSGAVGSGNEFINATVQKTFAELLGLMPVHSWHTQRDDLADFAAILGILTGSLGKIAKDVSLLMQTEVGEVFEGGGPGKGGSSAMPHKRNPVTCSAILANAQRTPQLVATLLSTLPQEHERSAGLWHAEWETLTELMQLCAGAVEHTLNLVSTLEVDKDKMLQNIELTQGLIFAENVALELAKKMGKNQAHVWVEAACKQAVAAKKHLKTVLLELQIDLTPERLDQLFLPENAIGLSLEIIDHILAQYDNPL